MDTDEFFPDCFINDHKSYIEFNGLIASVRVLEINQKEKIFTAFLGVASKQYINIIFKSKPKQSTFLNKKIMIKGMAIKTVKGYESTQFTLV